MVNLRETMIPASNQQNGFVVMGYAIEIIGSYILCSMQSEMRKENENTTSII